VSKRKENVAAVAFERREIGSGASGLFSRR
jgi:hypothetical protein